MTELTGAAYIVTGGAGAIGVACARRLLNDGASVLLVDPDAERLEAATAALSPFGAVDAHVSAISSPAEAAAVVAAAGDGLRGFVHMAGIFEHDGLDPDDHGVWDRAIAANLTNAYDLAVAWRAAPGSQMQGSIVMCSSVAFRRGAPGRAAYSAAKAGVVGLVRALSREFAPTTRVNAVAPGFIRTRMTEDIAQARGDDYLATIPMARFGRPEDVAGAVGFLCGPASAYMTGQVLNVDGGMWNS